MITLSQRRWLSLRCVNFFFQAEDGIRDVAVTGVQTCALPICFATRSFLPSAPLPSHTDRSPKATPSITLEHCRPDRKSTRLNSSHGYISYAVFCLKKKKLCLSHPTSHHAYARLTLCRACALHD